MKTIITFTFLLFSFLGFSQTTREEVVKRNVDGQKLIVNTYTGTGNSEKLIKITYYGDDHNIWLADDLIIRESPVSLKPIRIEYFGKYKETTNILKNYVSYKTGEVYEYNSYGVIKREEYTQDGTLITTWKIENDGKENNMFRIKYTLTP